MKYSSCEGVYLVERIIQVFYDIFKELKQWNDIKMKIMKPTNGTWFFFFFASS